MTRLITGTKKKMTTIIRKLPYISQMKGIPEEALHMNWWIPFEHITWKDILFDIEDAEFVDIIEEGERLK